MTPAGSIPIVFGIDVEPDPRLVDRRAALPWTGFESLHAHLCGLRRRIADRHGVRLRLSWFVRMDPQVRDSHGDAAWAARRYADLIGESLASGDELGLHVHAYRWDASAGDWIADHGNRGWIDECVRMSAQAFQDAFGRRCASYRMGDRYLDEATLALMESLGARVDLTVEPGYAASPAVFVEQPHTGSLPDFRRAPRRAYRPSRADFLRPDANGARAISILPLSTWKVPGLLAVARRVYVAARALRKTPLPDVLRRQRMMTLGFSLPPLLFRRMLDDLLAAEPGYLASIDRSHVGNDADKLRRFEVNLEHLLSHPLAGRFVFAHAEEIAGTRAAASGLTGPAASAS
jgi:hypothetical protein